MSTIMTTLVSVASSMVQKNTFKWASIHEANWSLDQAVKDVDWPVILCIPPEIADDRGESSVINTTVTVEMFFLGRYDQGTMEAIDAKVEADLMQNMLALGREFVYLLNKNDLINPNTDGIKDPQVWKPVYNWGDVNAYGYNVTLEIPIMEGITGCQH